MKSKSTNADSKEVSVAEPIGGVKVNAKKLFLRSLRY
jgi:hypothetical protein